MANRKKGKGESRLFVSASWYIYQLVWAIIKHAERSESLNFKPRRLPSCGTSTKWVSVFSMLKRSLVFWMSSGTVGSWRPAQNWTDSSSSCLPKEAFEQSKSFQARTIPKLAPSLALSGGKLLHSASVYRRSKAHTCPTAPLFFCMG